MQGTTLGQYRITGALGLGGMGAVYSAQHTLLGRAAAVKVLRPEFSDNQEIVTRFFNEARAAAAIRHPSIVEIYDFGWSSDGAAYLVMEHLAGESLATRLARGRIAIPEAATITRQIAGALAAAHRIGIVHRDLKPDNIFLVPDPEVTGGERIKLLDFGVAKLIADHDQHRMTRPGTVLGTPTYMAPEQCCGATVDHRADLYSLGCILFELCTGSPPFHNMPLAAVFAAHVYTVPPTLASQVAEVPPALDALVHELLIKDVAQRTQSADAVVRAIDLATGGFVASGRSHPWSVVGTAPQVHPLLSTLSGTAMSREPPPVARRRHPWVGIGSIAVIAATVGAIASGAIVRRAMHETPAPPAPIAATSVATSPSVAGTIEPPPPPLVSPSPPSAPAAPPVPARAHKRLAPRPAAPAAPSPAADEVSVCHRSMPNS